MKPPVTGTSTAGREHWSGSAATSPLRSDRTQGGSHEALRICRLSAHLEGAGGRFLSRHSARIQESRCGQGRQQSTRITWRSIPRGARLRSSIRTSCCGSRTRSCSISPAKHPTPCGPNDPRTRADIMRWQNWQSAHWGSDACMPLLFQNLVKTDFRPRTTGRRRRRQGNGRIQQRGCRSRRAFGKARLARWLRSHARRFHGRLVTSSTPQSVEATGRLLQAHWRGGSSSSPLCRAGPRLRRLRDRQWRPERQKQKGRPASRPLHLDGRTLSASAPAFRRGSRRSRAASCGRASRPRRISPAAGTADTWNPTGPRTAPASPTGRYRGR